MKKILSLLVSFVISVITAFLVTDAHNFANRTLDYFKVNSQDTRKLILSAVTTLTIGFVLYLFERLFSPFLLWISSYFKRSDLQISVFSENSKIDEVNFKVNSNGEYDNRKIQVRMFVKHNGRVSFYINKLCKTKILFSFEPERYMDIVEENSDAQLFYIDDDNNIVIDCFSNFSFNSSETVPMISLELRILPKRVAAATIFCGVKNYYPKVESKFLKNVLDKTMNLKMERISINCEGRESNG